MSGVIFSYAIIIFDEFYFGESKEPGETHVIKLSQQLTLKVPVMAIDALQHFETG